MTTPKHPNVSVVLIGEDGNAFLILAKATRALERAGVSREEIDRFRAEATDGDYNHLLRTVMEWMEVK